MIISKNGMVAVRGREEEILSDLSAAISSVHEALAPRIGEKHSKEACQKAFDLAFMSDEEINAEVEKADQKAATLLKDLMKLFEGRF